MDAQWEVLAPLIEACRRLPYKTDHHDLGSRHRAEAGTSWRARNARSRSVGTGAPMISAAVSMRRRTVGVEFLAWAGVVLNRSSVPFSLSSWAIMLKPSAPWLPLQTGGRPGVSEALLGGYRETSPNAALALPGHSWRCRRFASGRMWARLHGWRRPGLAGRSGRRQAEAGPRADCSDHGLRTGRLCGSGPARLAC
jgi:hypothetical protein